MSIDLQAEQSNQVQVAEMPLFGTWRFFQATLDALLDHIAILDEKGTIIAVNEAWRRFAEVNGYQGSDYGLGTNYLAICDQVFGEIRREAANIAEGIRAVIAGQLDSFHAEYPCHSPLEQRWFAVRITRFNSEGAIYVVVAHQNITQRVQTEERLRKLFRAVEQSPGMIIITDTAGQIEYVNPKFEQLTGYAAAEVIGQNIRILKSGEHEASYYQQLWQMVLADREWHGELLSRKKNGQLLWTSASIYPINNDQGHITHLVGVQEDITERKQAEEVARRVEALARSNAELEQFAYIASHDLHEPLRAIAGNLQQLEKRYTDQLDANAHKFITRAVAGVEHMQNLLEALLAYSRVGAPRVPVQPVSVTTSVKQALANLETALEDSKAIISYSNLPTIIADSNQLTQLFQNLISNAIKFRGKSQPQIHISAQFQPNDKAGNAVDKWLFSIQDNGIGLDPQFAERIFNIFQRLHTRSEYPGTGMGLAICKKIVEHHGGRIWVESLPAQGATFFFTIPFTGD